MGTQPAKFLLKKGTVLNGKWEVLDPIAKGGMAEIYRARQINLDREVALKVISDEFLESFEGDEEEIRATLERFRREVMMMAQVRHPNVLQVYDSDQATVKREGEERQVRYIAMEYVAGPDLRFSMPAEGFGHDEQAIRRWSHDYLLPILDGVETLHALGIIHRDLKPENILLDGQTPRIADFGIAGGHRWQRVTRSHHIVGTVPYQAGEQFLDMGETDVRADVYSLGKILYEAVSGRMVSKETAFPWRTAHLLEADTPFLKRLDRIVRQATAEDRNQRIPTVGALRQSLLEVLGVEGGVRAGSLEARSPWLLHWKPRALIAALALVAAAAVVTLILHLVDMRQRRAAAPSAQPSSSSVMSAAPSPGGEVTSTPKASNGSPVPALRGRDGAALKLVPAGEVTIAKESEGSAARSVKLVPFYMDDTKVTNHQFVDFLNQNPSRVAVQDGVVRGDGQIWLLLGAAKEGYEPVVFRDGMFHVKEPGFASYPVVRVTAHGAMAYAQFFGRRLPSEGEWLLARRIGQGLSESRTEEGSSARAIQAKASGRSEMERMHARTAESPPLGPAPVLDALPNALGLRGLDGGVGEWTSRLSPAQEGSPAYVVMPSAVPRFPWEAFAEVGFRCALTP